MKDKIFEVVRLSEKKLKWMLASICVIGIACLVITSILLGFFVKMGKEEEALNEGYERIMENWAADILNTINGNGEIKEVHKKYYYSNMDYSIVSSKSYAMAWDYGDWFSDDRFYNCQVGTKFDYLAWTAENAEYFQYCVDNIYQIMTEEVTYAENYNKKYDPEYNENYKDALHNRKYYTVAYKVADQLRTGDLIYQWNEFITNLYSYQTAIMVVFIASIMVTVSTLFALFVLVGNKENSDKIVLNGLDYIPVEILTIVMIVLQCLFGIMIKDMLCENWKISQIFWIFILIKVMHR